MTGEASVLVVEDDEELAGMIARYLGENGFRASIESRGDRAVDRVLALQPDLLILDLMLPGLDGLSICKRVRPRYRGSILMLTARGEDADEVVGLEIGADDYLAKPVRPRVLLARVRALLRRAGGEERQEREVVTVGQLSVDPAARIVRLAGAPLELTSTEFDLLWLLVSHAGEVLRREFLVERLRGEAYDGFDRSIDLRVSKLRAKIGDGSRSPKMIKTIRGVGYLFVAPEREQGRH